MQLLSSLLVLVLAYVVAAMPMVERRALQKNFFLVATPTKSAHPANTTGIDLFDPYYQANFLLRAQPDAGTYTQFNQSNGILSSTGSPAHVYNEYFEYESNIDATTGSIYLSQESGTKGLFSFKGNYLAYKGSVDGFTACVGDFYQIVINFNGTDPSCVPTYLFQQKTQPTSTFP